MRRPSANTGPTTRHRLAELVGARYWGPGRFRTALREAVHEGLAQPLARNSYAPPSKSADTDSDQ